MSASSSVQPVDDAVALKERLQAAEQVSHDLRVLESSVDTELAQRERERSKLQKELQDIKQAYGKLEGANIEVDTESLSVQEIREKMEKLAAAESARSLEERLRDEHLLRAHLHRVKKEKAKRVRTITKIDRELLRQQMLQEQTADMLEGENASADAVLKANAEKEREKKEAEDLERLDNELSEKLAAQEQEREVMLAASSDEEKKKLQEKLEEQARERAELEKKMHDLESRVEAEKEAREELEKVKENVALQKAAAEDGHRVLLAELERANALYEQTQSKMKDLEKMTEQEKAEALKAKEARELLLQEARKKDAMLAELAEEKRKAEEAKSEAQVEHQRKIDEMQVRLQSEVSQNQERLMQMARELDEKAAKFRQDVEDMKSKQLLVTGTLWNKQISTSKKEPRFVWVSEDLTRLQWQAPKKKVKTGEKVSGDKFIEVSTIKKIVAKTYATNAEQTPENMYGPVTGKTRALHVLTVISSKRELTLELEDVNDDDAAKWQAWLKALQYLVRQSRK